MSLNLSALKKNSSKDLLAKLQKGIEDEAAKGSKGKDDRFWSLKTDAAGNGSAILRFLPAKTEDAFPFVKVQNHAFQENGMWFITECPTTIGQECYCCQENGKLWNSGIEADKEIARKRKRATKYIANVLIVKDPANPENEGKIKLYKFGKKIFDKLNEAMNADEDLGETPCNPYAFFEGGIFVLRTQMVAGYLNYDKSKVVAAPDLYDGDETKLTEVLENMYDLQEFVNPKNFKSYDDIKARYIKVVSGASAPAAAQESTSQGKGASEYAPSTPAPTASNAASDDEDLAFFQSLVNE